MTAIHRPQRAQTSCDYQRSRNRGALSASALLLAALVGCGDDGVASTGSETTLVETTQMPSSTTTSETTGEDPTTGDIPTGATSTTEDGPTTGTSTACAETDDGFDDDADGVANTDDNCPCEANPNQLDFDRDAVGNVCDLPLKFSVVDGAPPELNLLTTTAHAKKALECQFGVDLMVRDGLVEVALDDAGTARLHLSSVHFMDTPELSCELAPDIFVKLRIQQFFAEGVDLFTVAFNFTLPDHEAGALLGMTDAAHEIRASAIINVTESPNEPLLPEGEEQLSDIPGVLPTTLVSVNNQGEQISLVFADDDTLLFEQTTGTGITFKLTGLTGTLRLKR